MSQRVLASFLSRGDTRALFFMPQEDYNKEMKKPTQTPCLCCSYPTQAPTEAQLYICPDIIAICICCEAVVFENGTYGYLKRDLARKIYHPIKN